MSETALALTRGRRFKSNSNRWYVFAASASQRVICCCVLVGISHMSVWCERVCALNGLGRVQFSLLFVSFSMSSVLSVSVFVCLRAVGGQSNHVAVVQVQRQPLSRASVNHSGSG